MEEDNLDDVWHIIRIIRSCGVQFNDNNDEDIKCIICKEVLINAHKGSCGCRYCFECIEPHFKEGLWKCPGITKGCKNVISIEKHIHPDQLINQKILSIIFKCPETNCDFNGDLKMIIDHRKMCKKRSSDYLYSETYCKESFKGATNMKNDKKIYIDSQTKKLLKDMNEVKVEKRDCCLKKYIHCLSIKDYPFLIVALTLFVLLILLFFVYTDRQEKRILAELGGEMKVLVKEIEQQKHDLSEYTIYVNNLKLKNEKENKETKEKLKEIKKELIEERKKTTKLRKDMTALREEIEQRRNDSSEYEKYINSLQIKYENENKEIKKKLKEVNYELIEEQRIITDLRSEMKTLREEIKQRKNDSSEYEKYVKQFQTKYERNNEEVNLKVKRLVKETVTLKNQIEKLNKRIVDLRLISNKNENYNNDSIISKIINNNILLIITTITFFLIIN